MDPIPLVDMRDGGPLAHVQANIERAAALRDACLAPAPRWSHGALSVIDGVAGRWLRRSGSLYREELENIAEFLGFPGALTLNLSYLFACTTSASLDGAGRPRLRRSLDWPFHGLGKCVEVAWQAGPAGEYFNVTWPGAVGVLTAMAPGRFAAAINAAPMQRRTRSLLGVPYDIALNIGQALGRSGDWPPDHLLRYAFETCRTFDAAIALLAREPLARPALFTLTGVHPDEMAVVERTEREARVIRGAASVANDWQQPRAGWHARMGHENNVARRSTLAAVGPEEPPFRWVTPPVLNKLTRLVVELSAAGAGEVLARGYEAKTFRDMPTPATRDFRLGGREAARTAA